MIDRPYSDDVRSNVRHVDEWTAWRGIRQAVVWGGLAAIGWIALLAVPTWHVPGVVVNV